MSYFSCSVPGCPVRKTDNDPEISFHGIPVKERMRNQWLQILSKQKSAGKTFVLTDFSTVCSRHFRTLDFKKNCKKRTLVPTAFPSIFPRCPSTLDFEKRARKSTLTTQNEPPVSTKNLDPKSDNCKVTTAEDETNKTSLVEVEVSSSGSHKNVGVQVSSLQTGQLKKLRGVNVRLKAKHNKLREQLKALNEKLALSERKVEGLPEYHQFQKVKSAKKSVKGMILIEQFKNYGKRQSDWDESTLQECLEWRNCDHRNYDYARKKQIVHLPSRITLDRFWKSNDPQNFNNHKKNPIFVRHDSISEKVCYIVIQTSSDYINERIALKNSSFQPEKRFLNIPYFSNDTTCNGGELQVVIIDSTPTPPVQSELAIKIDVSIPQEIPLNLDEILGSEILPTTCSEVDTSNSGNVIHIEMSPY